MAAQLKNQIAGLQRKLAKLEFNGNPTRAATTNAPGTSKSGASKRRNRRAARVVPAARRYVAPIVVNPNPKTVRRPAGAIPADGTIRVRRKELVLELKAPLKEDASHVIRTMVASFPWLKGLANSYDRVKWNSLVVHYKPAVSTNVSGMVMMGFDFDSNNYAKVDVAKVSALTPCLEVPAWQLASMTIPSSKLMTRKQYRIHQFTDEKDDNYELQPGFIIFYTSVTTEVTVGHIWIEYDVTLSGTTIQ